MRDEAARCLNDEGRFRSTPLWTSDSKELWTVLCVCVLCVCACCSCAIVLERKQEYDWLIQLASFSTSHCTDTQAHKGSVCVCLRYRRRIWSQPIYGHVGWSQCARYRVNQSAVTSEVRQAGWITCTPIGTHTSVWVCVYLCECVREREEWHKHILRWPTFPQHGDVRTVMQQGYGWCINTVHGWEEMDKQEEVTPTYRTTPQTVTLSTYFIRNIYHRAEVL